MKYYYDLLTVDVWDTMIRRDCHPDSSKLASARYLNLVYSSFLKEDYPDHWAVFRRRCAIEGSLARKREQGGEYGEYSLEEVIEILLDDIFGSNPGDIKQIKKKICEFELQFELSHVYPDDGIIDIIAQQQAKSVYFLTDFYMSEDPVGKILESCKMRHLIHGGISSCDVGKNKRSGLLFDHVHSTFNVRPDSHLHIGDNPVSDVSVPSRLGVDVIEYRPEEETLLRYKKESFLHDRSALFSCIESETETACRTIAGTCGNASAFMTGIKAAPLYIGFMLHVAEKSLLSNVEFLYFFTREGEFYLQIWKSMFPDNLLLGAQLPTPRILEVSRISTFAASLSEVNTNEMMRVWNLYSTQSPHAFFRTLNIDTKDLIEICHRYQIDLFENIVYPWLDDRMNKLFLDSDFQNMMQIHCRRERHSLLSYLETKGIGKSSENIGIVDIGWRGTIQDNIALLFPNTTFHGYYMGLQPLLNSQPPNCTKSAYLVNENDAQQERGYLDNVKIMEILCNSPLGMTCKYTMDENRKFKAIRLIDEKENQTYLSFTRFFQQGCLSACPIWSRQIESYIVSSEELRDLALSIWIKINKNPSDDVAYLYLSSTHNEQFGVGGYIEECIPKISDFFAILSNKENRAKSLLNILRSYIPWIHHKHLIWRKSNISILDKLFFYSLFSLLHFVRKRCWIVRFLRNFIKI